MALIRIPKVGGGRSTSNMRLNEQIEEEETEEVEGMGVLSTSSLSCNELTVEPIAVLRGRRRSSLFDRQLVERPRSCNVESLYRRNSPSPADFEEDEEDDLDNYNSFPNVNAAISPSSQECSSLCTYGNDDDDEALGGSRAIPIVGQRDDARASHADDEWGRMVMMGALTMRRGTLVRAALGEKEEKEARKKKWQLPSIGQSGWRTAKRDSDAKSPTATTASKRPSLWSLSAQLPSSKPRKPSSISPLALLPRTAELSSSNKCDRQESGEDDKLQSAFIFRLA